jgi:hypothetical protein
VEHTEHTARDHWEEVHIHSESGQENEEDESGQSEDKEDGVTTTEDILDWDDDSWETTTHADAYTYLLLGIVPFVYQGKKNPAKRKAWTQNQRRRYVLRPVRDGSEQRYGTRMYVVFCVVIALDCVVEV